MKLMKLFKYSTLDKETLREILINLANNKVEITKATNDISFRIKGE